MMRCGIRSRRGFTLVELAVVVVIIGVLAAFGIPRFIKTVERSKAAEAFHFLASVRSAQERYHNLQGKYTLLWENLDITAPAPKYFSIGPFEVGDTADIQDSWRITLTRRGASAGFGPYTVTFTEDGFDELNSTISNLPDINPFAQ